LKAVVQDRFGPPDVLKVADTALPEAGPGDVLVRVHAAQLWRTRPSADGVTGWAGEVVLVRERRLSVYGEDSVFTVFLPLRGKAWGLGP